MGYRSAGYVRLRITVGAISPISDKSSKVYERRSDGDFKFVAPREAATKLIANDVIELLGAPREDLKSIFHVFVIVRKRSDEAHEILYSESVAWLAIFNSLNTAFSERSARTG